MTQPPFDIQIRTLAPIWTGSASGKPEGLKASGLIGSMRHAFEKLVRQAGGRTCDIIGPAECRCNFEKDERICPACALFGCTGLARAFKINLATGEVPVEVPQTDNLLPNRDHTNKKYNVPCSVDTWLASITGAKAGGMLNPKEHGKAQQHLNSLRVAWSQDVLSLQIVPLRPVKGCDDIGLLLRHLLAHMAAFGGLGAKIRQGWGVFELAGGNPDARLGADALRALVAKYPFDQDWDRGLPCASDDFSVEWKLASDNLKFSWPAPPPPPRPYKSLGYALCYRLRRFIKFYEVDKRGMLPVAPDSGWRLAVRGLRGKSSACPWKNAIPFVRGVFGRDNSDDSDKHSGRVGVSHLFQRDGAWHVRLFGNLPDACPYRGEHVQDDSIEWDKERVRGFLVKAMEDTFAMVGNNAVQTAHRKGGLL